VSEAQGHRGVDRAGRPALGLDLAEALEEDDRAGKFTDEAVAGRVAGRVVVRPPSPAEAIDAGPLGVRQADRPGAEAVREAGGGGGGGHGLDPEGRDLPPARPADARGRPSNDIIAPPPARVLHQKEIGVRS
jgi:hypothetical protein